MVGAQHIGAFRHEVDAAKHDEVGVGMLRHMTRKLVRVAGVIGELDHFVALVVMAQNYQPPAKLRFCGGYTRVHLLIGQPDIPFR